MRRPVFLTGMMGSGKSTVGRLLAAEAEAEFVDLDVRIERLFGQRIADMLGGANADPAKFRARERLALTTLLDEPGFAQRRVVVATGGGVVLDAHNRRQMRQVGTVVYLRVAVEVLASRLSADIAEDPQARPLLPPAVVDLRARLLELSSARTADYDDCDLTVDGAGPAQMVASRILAALREATVSGEREHEAV